MGGALPARWALWASVVGPAGSAGTTPGRGPRRPPPSGIRRLSPIGGDTASSERVWTNSDLARPLLFIGAAVRRPNSCLTGPPRFRRTARYGWRDHVSAPRIVRTIADGDEYYGRIGTMESAGRPEGLFPDGFTTDGGTPSGPYGGTDEAPGRGPVEGAPVRVPPRDGQPRTKAGADGVPRSRKAADRPKLVCQAKDHPGRLRNRGSV